MATSLEDEWEDIAPQNESDWEDVAPSQPIQQPGIIQRTMQNTGMDMSPAGLLNMGVGKIQEGAKALGGRATEILKREGVRPLFGRESIPVSPGVAEGIGTAVKYAPDVAMMAASPVDTSKTAIKAAVPMARRALGFQKRFLNTPFARGQATKAAEIGLEEGIISGSGNPQTMFQRASDLATKSGEAIKKTIKDVPVEAQDTWQNLENLRGQITQGIGREGNLASVHKAIDEVQRDISDLISLSGQKPSNKLFAPSLNKLKNRIGNSLNFLADAASQQTNKDITGNLANTIREAVKKFVNPEEFTKYLENQRLYNAAALMKKGLNNELAAQMGNKIISPYSAIAATGQLAAGMPGSAAATLGLTEGLVRRGMGAGASAIQAVGKAAPTVGIASSVQAAKPILKKRQLDKQTAAQYLDRAGGDVQKALELAEADGY